MNKSNYRVFIFLIFLWTQFSHATEIYQWQDAQGQQHFSDKKNNNSSVYELHEEHSFYTVNKVYDGDTVKISDGRKIRLLGINTPEIEHAQQLEQAGGDLAKQWLSDKLLNKRIRLEYDQEKRDKYKRVLAHVFTEQGRHINADLVRLGYASANIYPPNLKYVNEILQAENSAQANKLGIWHYPAYQSKDTGELNKTNKRGWQRIKGRVSRVYSTSKNHYLRLDADFYIRINIKYSQYFAELEQLQGKLVEVRGWVRRYKEGYSMSIRHSSALIIID